LENQKFFKPNKINKLQDELKEKVDYWIVSGAIGSGKTTISKFISS
jgi:tRNA A37 threonylcarbamoyladenosine biosynthesis protein TsaE